MPHFAVYPGSFDPPTMGHKDLIDRAASLFDRLVVAVGINRSKNPFLIPDQRIEALKRLTSGMPNVEVTSFEGLLVNYAVEIGADCILRGLRATADFEYEFQMAMANKQMQPNLETVFLMTKWEYSYVSSSIVRDVATFGGDYSAMVPDSIHAIIEARVRESR